MKLIRYTHKQSLGSPAFGRIGSLFDEIFDSTSPHSNAGVDFFEDAASFYIRLELPGVKKAAVDLQLEGGVLSVRTHADAGNPANQMHLKQSISLPDAVVVDKVSARLQDGILTVSLPKVEAVKPRSITVN